jgi:hypothetical protein
MKSADGRRIRFGWPLTSEPALGVAWSLNNGCTRWVLP